MEKRYAQDFKTVPRFASRHESGYCVLDPKNRYNSFCANDPHTGEPVTIEKTTTTDNSGAGAAVWSGTLSLLETVVLLPVRAVGILIHAIL